MHNNSVDFHKHLHRALAVLCATAIGLSLAACSDSDDSSAASGLDTMTGITAKGELGQKPEISFKTPLDVTNGSYQIVQKGDGEPLADGDHVCTQQIVYNATTGEELTNTWDQDTPDCSLAISKNSIAEEYYDLFKGMALNTSVALGIDASSSNTDGTSTSSDKYVNVITLVSKITPLKRATGETVTDLPAGLPTVTLGKKGKPSIDMNGQGSVDSLVTQTLIKGDGETLTDSDTAVVKYTGWLTDGTQFDSSWDKNTTFDADLSASGQIIEGWKQGLIGQTVGSQVMLIIPPDLGYGSQELDGIPADSTLVFVIDILAAY